VQALAGLSDFFLNCTIGESYAAKMQYRFVTTHIDDSGITFYKLFDLIHDAGIRQKTDVDKNP
jgi:hypothetical protein